MPKVHELQIFRVGRFVLLIKLALALSIQGRVHAKHQISKNLYLENKIDSSVFSFDKDLNLLINQADLCITRAGASSLAEISLLRKPFIAIPLPSSKDNHQLENTKLITKIGGGWVLDQNNEIIKTLNAMKVRVLASLVIEITIKISIRGNCLYSIFVKINMVFSIFKSKPKLSELIPNGFIDIHSHILPGIDDGAENISQTLNFERCSFEEFQKKYEPTTRSIAADIYPVDSTEIVKWKAFYKMSVDISKLKFN